MRDMTRNEVKKIVAMVTAAWPTHFEKMTPSKLESLISAWDMGLEDYTYEQGEAGLKSFIKSDGKGFPPSPGQVANMVESIIRPPMARMNALEAWETVREGIRDSTYGAQEHFDAFPPLIQKAVGSPSNLREWGQLTSEQVTNNVQPRFIKAYDSLMKQAEEVMMLPKDIRERMLNIAGVDAVSELMGGDEAIGIEG